MYSIDRVTIYKKKQVIKSKRSIETSQKIEIKKRESKYKSNLAPFNGAHVPFFWPNHQFSPHYLLNFPLPLLSLLLFLFSLKKKQDLVYILNLLFTPELKI